MAIALMEAKDIDVELILERAKRLEEEGDRMQALELYQSALERMTKDNPHRRDVESAVTYLHLSTVLAIAPAQMRAWQNLTGWSPRWRPVRYGILVLLVLFEIGMLLLGKRGDFEGILMIAWLSGSGSLVPASFVTPTPGLDLGLELAPTPLTLAPTAADPPPMVATATETLVPSPTPTANLAPTPTSLPTVVPLRVASPSNSAGGGSGGNGGSPSGGLTVVPPGSNPAPQPQPTPKPAPGPQPTPQPGPGPQPIPGPGPKPSPDPGPGGSGNPGQGGNQGGNHGGNGKGKGNGGGKGK